MPSPDRDHDRPGPAARPPSADPTADSGADRPGGGTHPALAGASAEQVALATAVREIERHVARGGWDAPVRVFALIATARALAERPELANELPADVVATARRDPTHLTSVEQEGLPRAADLEQLLGSITWPPTVDGAAVVVERVVLPTEAEEDLPGDPDEALERLLSHPRRQDVRLAVGVMRDGGSWCAVRARAHDDDASVGMGPNLVPGLVAAVRATFDEDVPPA